MAMSAAAAVMMIMVVIAVAVVMAAAAATAVFTAHPVNHTCNLVVGCLTVLNHMTYEMEVFTSTWVIEVNGYGIRLHLDDCGVETFSVFTLKRNDVALKNTFLVEASVNLKHVLWNVEHQFVLDFTVGIGTRDDEIKFITFL